MSDSSIASDRGPRSGSANGMSSQDTKRHDTNLTELQERKIEQIRKACDERNYRALRELATSKDGLVTDDARHAAWPVLLGSAGSQNTVDRGWKELDRHPEEDQVALDVNRSFVHYPENESAKKTEVRKLELSNVITAVLRRHPMLCYFQGFHDIAQVLLLVLGADAAEAAVARLSLLRIRDFMLPTLAGAESHLNLLPSILYAADTDLYQHLSKTAKPTPFFALAATLTLYAHDIEDYGDIARLFDYLLASEAAVPVYLFAAIIISRKAELLEIEPEDSDMLHFILSKLPKPLDIEGLIERTIVLFKNHPPEHLPNRAWSRVSSASVLKTTRDPDALAKQTLQYGERLFDQQAKEIEKQERRKRLRSRVQKILKDYRRPAKWTGAAVLVAILAFYVGRSSDTPLTVQGIISTALIFGQRTYNTLQGFLIGTK